MHSLLKNKLRHVIERKLHIIHQWKHVKPSTISFFLDVCNVPYINQTWLTQNGIEDKGKLGQTNAMEAAIFKVGNLCF